MKFYCPLKSPSLKARPAVRCRSLASCRVSPALLACLAFQSYFSFLLPLMKSSSLLLLLFLACLECHGMCVADKPGFLLVSWGRRFLIANFSDARSGFYLPFLFGVGRVSYQKINLLGSVCLLVIPSSRFSLLLFVLSLPRADPWNCVWEESRRGGEREERCTNRRS